MNRAPRERLETLRVVATELGTPGSMTAGRVRSATHGVGGVDGGDPAVARISGFPEKVPAGARTGTRPRPPRAELDGQVGEERNGAAPRPTEGRTPTERRGDRPGDVHVPAHQAGAEAACRDPAMGLSASTDCGKFRSQGVTEATSATRRRGEAADAAGGLPAGLGAGVTVAGVNVRADREARRFLVAGGWTPQYDASPRPCGQVVATMTHSTWTGFYTSQEVARLAHIPKTTLYRWQREGIIMPSLEGEDGEYGYSYADLTIVRLLRAIREKRIDFRSAGVALRHLYGRLGPPSAGWSDANIYFVPGPTGRIEVYAFHPDEWELTDATRSGQRVEPRLLGDALSSLASEIAGLRDDDSVVVPREFRDFVTINPDIRGGAPIVKGTRIPTRLFAALNQGGRTAKQIARMYSGITARGVEAVLAYEKQYLDTEASAA